MIKRFSELYRVYQGMAVDIGFIVFVKFRTGKHKGCYLLPVISKPDVFKITAHAHKKRAPEYVCGF